MDAKQSWESRRGDRQSEWANLAFRICHKARTGVGTVANVPTDIDGKVTSDCAWERGERVGSAQENSSLLDDVLSLPDHGDDWARGHVAVGLRGVRARERRSLRVSTHARHELV